MKAHDVSMWAPRLAGAIAAAAMCIAFAAGCDVLVPQEVTGTVRSGASPVMNATLRLYHRYDSCDGEYVETRTGSNGSFRS